MLTDTIKNELIKGLLEIFQGDISMIILYGSVARNEAGPESDIDIAIIMKKDMDEDRKDRFISWSADMDIRYDRVFSIVDIREDNMKKWGNVLPFYRNVQEEGVVLWKAA
ncbi:MAG: nucleotidyltransferase domain-containing protein [Blautia sp.]|nr:nucleotidyltransferase domain-containing protein [Blautia sp.]MDY5665044.1 nucleotidyltransferase domain-containing protein [Blautia sp.]